MKKHADEIVKSNVGYTQKNLEMEKFVHNVLSEDLSCWVVKKLRQKIQWAGDPALRSG